MRTIVIGSSSPQKLQALVDACRKLGIEASISTRDTNSRQNAQPVGYEETLNGALNRASQAWGNGEHLVIGIESGIFRFGFYTPVTLDMAIIVIIKPDLDRIVMNSAGIQFPEEYVRIAEERGFKTTTVGSVIAERLGGDPADPHSTLTNGKVTRKALLTEALVAALVQL
jgi:non-canonical (house-cleaning) NTP pyrophosphatase